MLNPPHPGLSVKHDCIEALGLTVTCAAEILGVTRQTLNDLVHCRRGGGLAREFFQQALIVAVFQRSRAWAIYFLFTSDECDKLFAVSAFFLFEANA